MPETTPAGIGPDETSRRVRESFRAQHLGSEAAQPATEPDLWVREVLDDVAIVEGPDGLLAYPYEVGDSDVVFGEPMPVKVTYMPVGKADRDELKSQQASRSRQYGIAVKENTNLTPPAGYPTDPAMYGDPVNYRYPLNAGRLVSARGYFNHDGQQEAGGYSSSEWAVIGKRIARASSSGDGDRFVYASGKVVPAGDVSKEDREQVSLLVGFAKADPVKQLVYGIVMEPGVPDSEGDVTSAEEIERACHEFMVKSQRLDYQHERLMAPQEATLVENYIAPQNLIWETPRGLKVVAKGSWVMVTKIFSDDVWAQVEKGELGGYSIFGYGKRTRRAP